jgi:hypothetical protein
MLQCSVRREPEAELVRVTAGLAAEPITAARTATVESIAGKRALRSSEGRGSLNPLAWLRGIGMLPTVDLSHELARGYGEIGDVASDRMLPTNFVL